MRNFSKHSSKLILLAIVAMMAFGCKSSKKMEAAKAKEKAKMEQEQAALRKQKEDEARKREAEEKARREAEQKLANSKPKEVATEVKLNSYFEAISSSTNVTSANASINEALTLFASPDALVLIIISQEGDQKDYDRPTTIKEYLHYLKDQKKNANAIATMKVNSAGKITELELKKP